MLEELHEDQEQLGSGGEGLEGVLEGDPEEALEQKWILALTADVVVAAEA